MSIRNQKGGRARKRIALFGGSFDPPHYAHVLAVAQLAAGPFDEVWVIPCPGHAFGKKLAPFRDRMALCRAAFGNIRNVKISPIENTLPLPARTLNTVRELKQQHPGITFILAFGADVYRERKRWYRFADIEKEVEVVYFRRTGTRMRKGPNWLSDVEFGDVSSTRIRNALARGMPVDRWVPPRVIAEIYRRGLYSSTSRNRNQGRTE